MIDTMRPATFEDADLLFNWVNDPDVRQNSIHSEPIAWEEHKAWFHDHLAMPECSRIFIGIMDKTPVGQIRFDLNGQQAAVTLSVDRLHRGKGIGKELLHIGLDKMMHIWPQVQVYVAIIKDDNIFSQKVFECLGFRLASSINGIGTYHMKIEARI